MSLGSPPVRSFIISLNTLEKPLIVIPFVDKRCKKTIEEVQATVDDAISSSQIIKIRQCLAYIDELEEHKADIEQEIQQLSIPYAPVLKLIRTIPGLNTNPMTAIWNVLNKVEAYDPAGYFVVSQMSIRISKVFDANSGTSPS